MESEGIECECRESWPFGITPCVALVGSDRRDDATTIFNEYMSQLHLRTEGKLSIPPVPDHLGEHRAYNTGPINNDKMCGLSPNTCGGSIGSFSPPTEIDRDLVPASHTYLLYPLTPD